MCGAWLAGVSCLLTLLAAPRPAAATATITSPYSYHQTFGSALRLVKVDLDLAVTEVNGEWGYFTFTYTSRESGQRKNRGSFSFVRGRDQVKVTLQIPQMPSYHEQLMIEKLARKLAAEHGAPSRHEKKPPPDSDDDQADRDDDDDSAKRGKSKGDKHDGKARRHRRRSHTR